MSQMTAKYESALAAMKVAQGKFNRVSENYRARKIDDAEYLAARKAYKAAEAAFDAAYAEESARDGAASGRASKFSASRASAKYDAEVQQISRAVSSALNALEQSDAEYLTYLTDMRAVATEAARRSKAARGTQSRKPRALRAAAGTVLDPFETTEDSVDRYVLIMNEVVRQAHERMVRATRLQGPRGRVAGRASAADRLFIGVYPGGIVYADRSRERDGDYVRLAFLPYDTLVLAMEKGVPADLKAEILKSAAKIQKRRGEKFAIDAAGHSVFLGSKLGRAGGSSGTTSAGLAFALRQALGGVPSTATVAVDDTYVEGPLRGTSGGVFVRFVGVPYGSPRLDAMNARVSFLLTLESPLWNQHATEVRVRAGEPRDVPSPKVKVRQVSGRTKVRAYEGTPEKVVAYVVKTVEAALASMRA
jgi:hypothetical protein